MVFTTVIANLMVTLAALLLVKRGPSKRLRLLTLVVGLMSLGQTAGYIQTQHVAGWRLVETVSVHQGLVAVLSLVAIYVLGKEIHDRRVIDRQVRLMEHELSTLNTLSAKRGANDDRKVGIPGGPVAVAEV